MKRVTPFFKTENFIYFYSIVILYKKVIQFFKVILFFSKRFLTYILQKIEILFL
jgi:hypothetical protein